MTIRWRSAARAELRAAIAYLSSHNPEAARELRLTIDRAANMLDRKPAIARSATYPGMRAWSLPKWSKIIIFREIDAGIEIVTLLDTRQQPPDRVG